MVSIPIVYPILDTATLTRLGFDPLVAAEALLEAGATLLQYRHKAFWSRDIFHEVQQIARLCDDARITLILNDRADFAALLGTGLHVGQEDLTPTDARRLIGPKALLGFSTHNPAQLTTADAEPVDYLAIGPIFATASKDRPDPTLGVEALKAIRPLTGKPLVAIGGITLDNLPDVLHAGANSVAIIAALLQEPCTKQNIRDRMTAWLHASAILL